MLSFAVYNGIENINWTMIFLTTCNKISKIILVSGVTFVFMYQSVHTFLKSFSTIFFFLLKLLKLPGSVHLCGWVIHRCCFRPSSLCPQQEVTQSWKDSHTHTSRGEIIRSETRRKYSVSWSPCWKKHFHGPGKTNKQKLRGCGWWRGELAGKFQRKQLFSVTLVKWTMSD